MSIVTRGQIYGVLGALALLGFFIVPPQIELNGTACTVWSLASAGCEAGLRGFFRGAVIYSLFAGYLISRIIDREPVVATWDATVIFIASVALLGLPLWLAIRAAFW